VRGDVLRALEAVSAARRATAEELEACEAVGELRARQGVPVEALIQAFQAGADRVLVSATAAGERLGAKPEHLLAYSRIGWAWANEAMTRAAQAHRRTELELARRDVHQRDELLRRLVLDGAPSADVRLRLPVYGLRPADAYHVTRARGQVGEAAGSELIEPVRRTLPAGALAGMVDGDVVVVSPAAPTLPDGWCAGTAGPAPLLELHAPFDDASRALDAAWSFGLAGTHRLDGLGALPGVVLDSRLGELLHARVVAALGSVAEQERICDTLEALFAHDMRVPDAARALYVHENTVRKRLRIAEERTGLTLRRVDELLVVWWALQYRRLRAADIAPIA
jgi:hypothetical protein